MIASTIVKETERTPQPFRGKTRGLQQGLGLSVWQGFGLELESVIYPL